MHNNIDLYCSIKMEALLIDHDVIDALFKSAELQSDLSDFENLNRVINCQTIVGLLHGLHWALSFSHGWGKLYYNTLIQRIHELGRSEDVMRINLAKNIVNLLMHPDIDFSVYQNNTVLADATVSDFMGNDQLDQILTRHNLDPDSILNGDSVKMLLKNQISDPERLLMFLKYRAKRHHDIEYNNEQLYFLATYDLKILDIVVAHTKRFDKLLICGDCEATHKVLGSVLRCGNLLALERLNRHTVNIQKYEQWLRTIRKCTTLDLNSLRSYFEMPIQNITLIDDNEYADKCVRKLILFKHNLECLAQSAITVPAYKYYDVAIVILFLIKNSHLTVLTSDVLRYIAILVFS